MIFQGGALLDSSNVEENVRLPLDLFTTMSMSEKRDRVNFCLKRVNLGDVNQAMNVSGENIRAATIVVSTIPILCVYPFLQKYFVKGITIGSVKG